MPDYSAYTLSRAQRIGAIAFGCAFCFGATWIVYRNAMIACAAALLGLLYPRRYADALRRKRKEKLRLQFKEALQVLSSLLAAGRSVENAFAALEGDLILLIGDAKSDLISELRAVINRLRNGETLENALHDFAARSDLEEARSFAEAITICKRHGGDLVEVVRKTSQVIGETLDVELEVNVLIARKKFEAKLMMGMPFAFVGVLGFIAPEYMKPLYGGTGWLLLTVCMLLLGCCCWWIFRIMDIKL